MNGAQDRLVFRHHRIWLVVYGSLAVLAVCGIPLFTRDPEYWAAFFSLKALLSVTVVMLTTVGGGEAA